MLDITVLVLFLIFFGGPLILIGWAGWVRWQELKAIEPFQDVGDLGQNDIDQRMKG